MARDQDRSSRDPARRMVERKTSARLHARRAGLRQSRAVVEDRQRQLFRRIHGHTSLEIVALDFIANCPLRIANWPEGEKDCPCETMGKEQLAIGNVHPPTHASNYSQKIS